MAPTIIISSNSSSYLLTAFILPRYQCTNEVIMVSKAWYKSAAPRLIGKFTNSSSSSPRKAVEIWTTTCILTNFGKRSIGHNFENSNKQQPVVTLINPANPNLSGPNAFPYFPRGGPQPKVQPNRHAHHIMGYVSQWGGMDVGSGTFHVLFIGNN